MADEHGTETTETAVTETQTDSTSKTFTQADLDRIVTERVERERSKNADAVEKAKKFDELQEASKSDLEKVTGERDTLKTAAESAAAEALRLRVAVTKQLPAELIDRLRGSTKEELEADADELLKLVKPQGRTSFDGGKGRENATPADDMNTRLRKAVGRS